MRAMILSLAAMLLAATTGQLQAATIYSNGPINGTVNADNIQLASSASDSFSVVGNFTLTSLDLGLWVLSPQFPVSLSWSIGSNPFTSDIGSGTATPLTNGSASPHSPFLVFPSSFAISGVVTTGTYWITVTQGATSAGTNQFIGWDVNGGPSTTYLNGNSTPASSSHAFTIYGDAIRVPPNTPVVPEPTSLALAGFAGIGMAAGAWRRRRLAKSEAA